jgi:hypothetical protein
MTRLVPSTDGTDRLNEVGAGSHPLPSAPGHMPLATPMSTTVDAVLHCSCGAHWVGSDWRVAIEMTDHLTAVRRRAAARAQVLPEDTQAPHPRPPGQWWSVQAKRARRGLVPGARKHHFERRTLDFGTKVWVNGRHCGRIGAVKCAPTPGTPRKSRGAEAPRTGNRPRFHDLLEEGGARTHRTRSLGSRFECSAVEPTVIRGNLDARGNLPILHVHVHVRVERAGSSTGVCSRDRQASAPGPLPARARERGLVTQGVALGPT